MSSPRYINPADFVAVELPMSLQLSWLIDEEIDNGMISE